MFKKVNKTISLLHKLHTDLPKAPLVTIYKSFRRPFIIVCGYILYDQAFNYFQKNLESF